MANTDFFVSVGSPGTATTLSSPGHAIAGTTFNVISTSNWPSTAIFAVDTFTIQTVNGVATAVRNPGSYTEWQGDVTNATTISNAVIRFGTDQNYPAGSNTRVYIPVASSQQNRLMQGIAVHANQDGSLKQAAVQSALGLTNLNGYTPLGQVPSSVTYNGNRSYDIVLPTDLTGVISNGMRLRTTRTVTAPTQCTNLNGTTQYYSKTAPAGMTFTVTCTAMGDRKLNAYSVQWFGGRTTGTNGFRYGINAAGQLVFEVQPGNATTKIVTSYQSVPLNKHFRYAFQIDLAGTCQIMLDGVPIPSITTGAATSLTQAGDWQLGAANATGFTSGKMAQDALFSAKLADATVRLYENQNYLGSETSLISAYSFSNTINDLNTTNANNLTANGGAVATNADSPFTQDDTGTPSGSNDFAIVTKKVFSTNTTLTIQVPEGCAVPTIGGVSSVVYSSNATPYGFPKQKNRWPVYFLYFSTTNPSQGSPAVNTWYNPLGIYVTAPVGDALITTNHVLRGVKATTGTVDCLTTISTTTNSSTIPELGSYSQVSGATGTLVTMQPVTRNHIISPTTPTNYYFLSRTNQSGQAEAGYATDWGGGIVVTIETAHL